jgi:hypothetical protein
MRQEILEYVQALNLGTVTVSSELPWTDNGQPLYLKNLKRVYVDIDNITSEPFIQALNGLNVSNEITSVRLYFACDAKVLLPNYSDIIDQLKEARNITTVTAIQRREFDITTSVENDVLVTELEYRYIKLLT